MDLLNQFKKNATALGLAAYAPPTLLAVSGGLDSMVLAHLFREAGLPFGIAHCNFGLRGAESDGDADFVEKTATAWGIPFFVKHFETETYATQHGLSIQMAARELRYAWFAEICREHGFARLATAHHLNDAVETMLLNLVRGTGLRGMASRSSFHHSSSDHSPFFPSETSGEGHLSSNLNFQFSILNSKLTPLESIPRADLEAYARAHQIAWREDSSNASDDYARNFVRHHVLPLLTELNPNFLHTTERTMRRLGEVEANYGHLLSKHFGANTDIPKSLLRGLPAPRQALHELLRPYGFTEDQARQLAENLDHIGLELYSGTGWRVLNDREKIILVASNPQASKSPSPQINIQHDDLMVSLPDGSRLVLLPATPQPPYPNGREAVLVDAARLQFPLVLRAWQPGDWFQPYGMGGQRQKLQDFFVNQKLTRLDKERTWVLENGDGTIVWVLGHRMDERFRVTAQTEQGLKIGLT